MRFDRYLTTENEQYDWKKVDVLIKDHRSDKVLFQAKDVIAPKSWTQQSVDIVASKYFRREGVPSLVVDTVRHPGDEKMPSWLRPKTPYLDAQFSAENDVGSLFKRLVGAWTYWAWRSGVFKEDGEKSARVFYDELFWMMYHQYMAPNSPQFFNTGLWWAYGIEGNASGHWAVEEKTGEAFQVKNLYERSQAHACFILGIEDSLLDKGGIYDSLMTEARIFKLGSGSGINYSNLRAEGEKLSGGGTSSGLLSFLRIFDRSAECIKSGGVTRRSARMLVTNVSHPDVMNFIQWKSEEEKKAKALIAAGYDADFNGETYRTISGQNGNNSVNVTHDFMSDLKNDRDWSMWWVLDQRNVAQKEGVFFPPSAELMKKNDVKPAKTVKARKIWRTMAESAWSCADPGLLFGGTVNDWNTLSAVDKIQSSNPCGEYLSVNNSACNLLSINTLKFFNILDKTFNMVAYQHVIRMCHVILDVSNTMAELPSKEIAENVYKYRATGMGPANLGTLLMVMGVPYDSDKARTIASSLMAIMTASCYSTSAMIAKETSPFYEWSKNAEATLRIVRNHRRAAYGADHSERSSFKTSNGTFGDYEGLTIKPVELVLENTENDDIVKQLVSNARKCWDEALSLGASYGYRNAHVTVAAPTGTISFVMGCDSTGIEPNYALVSYKTLAGGGVMKIVNKSVDDALFVLGYEKEVREKIVSYIEERGYVNGAPGLQEKHYAVFKCAVSPIDDDDHVIHWRGHVKMLASLQSFVSGAISKTINMPENTTVEEIEQAYELAYDLGCKGITVYRDNCKSSAPLSVKKQADKVVVNNTNESLLDELVRRLDDKMISVDDIVNIVKSRVVDASKDNNWGLRRKPDDTMRGFRHRIMIGQSRGYLKVFTYDDGRIAELFVTFGNPGSSLSNVIECWSIAFSLALQRGEPLGKLCKKFVNVEFEPKGFTGRRDDLRLVSSPIDYIVRLLMKYFDDNGYEKRSEENKTAVNKTNDVLEVVLEENKEEKGERPFCPQCGAQMMGGTVRCPTCDKCGYFKGCG